MSFLIGAVTVITATFVVFAYLLFIWWLDRYEREPLWLVLLVFAFGGLFGTTCACMISILPAIAASALGEVGDMLTIVVVAPVVEEVTKGAVFLLLIWSKHFDNETDGLIYGAATGLGFACIENLLYFAGTENLAELVMLAALRTLFTALVHATSSAMLGMAIGYARRRGLKRGALFVLLGYVLAVLNHGLWNGAAVLSGFATLQELGLSMFVTASGFLLIVLVSLMMFVITQFSLSREHKMIKRYLKVEADLGVIPHAHAEIVPFWLKRYRAGWLDPRIDRKKYVKAATTLAFRSYQLEDAEGERRVRIETEIAQQRATLRTLLAAA